MSRPPDPDAREVAVDLTVIVALVGNVQPGRWLAGSVAEVVESWTSGEGVWRYGREQLFDERHPAGIIVEVSPREDDAARESPLLCVIAEDDHDGPAVVVTLDTEEVGPLPLAMCELHRKRLAADIEEAARG